MKAYPQSIQKIIEQFTRLPGIGSKTAERLTFAFLRKSPTEKKEFADAFLLLANQIVVCPDCGYVRDTASALCVFCEDTRRQRSVICVVSDIQTVQTIEHSGAYKGMYHILGGTLNPLEGISADQLAITPLHRRLSKKNSPVKEVLIATGTDIEGEQTALYLAHELKKYPVTITRLARGIPRGSSLEYADEITVADAITNRQHIT